MKIKFVTIYLIGFFLSFIFSSSELLAQKKTIALTIDDLPFVGEARNFHLNLIMTALKEQKVPATGFIIAREIRPNNWNTLFDFRDAGFGLGNHTYSHANLNELTAEEYIQEIRKSDKILASLMTEPKYFRYPYLAMSSGDKRNQVLCYLENKKYQVAPITIDSKDFIFNQRLLSQPEMNRRAYLNELKPFYLDFVWYQTLKAEQKLNSLSPESKQAQILLIHANLLNAYVLPDLINLFQKHGYKFISLQDALISSSTLRPAACSQDP